MSATQPYLESANNMLLVIRDRGSFWQQLNLWVWHGFIAKRIGQDMSANLKWLSFSLHYFRHSLSITPHWFKAELQIWVPDGLPSGSPVGILSSLWLRLDLYVKRLDQLHVRPLSLCGCSTCPCNGALLVYSPCDRYCDLMLHYTRNSSCVDCFEVQ